MSEREPSEGYSLQASHEGFGEALVLHGPWQRSFGDLLRGDCARVLRLSDRVGWHPEDLGFLRGKELRGLEIYADARLDVTVVEEMTSLELLGLECECTAALDLSRLARLTHALVTWPKRGIAHLFDRPQLEHLNIEKFPFEDLGILQTRPLKRLQLTSRKLQSLDGVSNLSSLHTLDLLDCYKLESIDDLARCNIHVLEIENSKRLSSLEPLRGLRTLECLILSGCGEVDSVVPLLECRSLAVLILGGNTKIADGDLAILTDNPRLKTFRFQNRRHYNLRHHEVDELLMDRRRARRAALPSVVDTASWLEALSARMEDEDIEAIDAVLCEAPANPDPRMVEGALKLIRQELAGPGEWQIMVLLETLPVDVFLKGLLRAAALVDEQSPFALRTILQRRLEDGDWRDSLAALMARRPQGWDVIAAALLHLASSHPSARAVLDALGLPSVPREPRTME